MICGGRDENASASQKTGILFAAYGVANPQADKALRVLKESAERFFSLPVRLAITSENMRIRLADARAKSDSVHKALCRMSIDRYDRAVVQPLHLIPGLEYAAVLDDVQKACRKHPLRAVTGRPLLCGEGDAEVFAGALLDSLRGDAEKGDALVCLAHGSPHANRTLYSMLDAVLSRMDCRARVFCMNRRTDVPALFSFLRGCDPDRVLLVPLLSSVGRHTLVDIGGDGEESWKSLVRGQGFECVVRRKGLAEFPQMRDLWFARVGEALAAFDH